MFITRPIKQFKMNGDTLKINELSFTFNHLSDDDVEILESLITKGAYGTSLLFLNSKSNLISINEQKVSIEDYANYLKECKDLLKECVTETSARSFKPLTQIDKLEIMENEKYIARGKGSTLLIEDFRGDAMENLEIKDGSGNKVCIDNYGNWKNQVTKEDMEYIFKSVDASKMSVGDTDRSDDIETYNTIDYELKSIDKDIYHFNIIGVEEVSEWDLKESEEEPRYRDIVDRCSKEVATALNTWCEIPVNIRDTLSDIFVDGGINMAFRNLISDLGAITDEDIANAWSTFNESANPLERNDGIPSIAYEIEENIIRDLQGYNYILRDDLDNLVFKYYTKITKEPKNTETWIKIEEAELINDVRLILNIEGWSTNFINGDMSTLFVDDEGVMPDGENIKQFPSVDITIKEECEGTQCSDIAEKKDQEVGGSVKFPRQDDHKDRAVRNKDLNHKRTKKSGKEEYSLGDDKGMNEMFNIPKNHKFKGFMIAESGHFERGNYVLINENGKIKAVNKNKLQESEVSDKSELPNNIKKAKLFVNDDPTFDGYMRTDYYWNGWACPYFNLDTCFKILDYFFKDKVELNNKIFWDDKNSDIYFYDKDTDTFYEYYAEHGTDDVDLASIDISDTNNVGTFGTKANINGEDVYDLGAMNWTWEEDTSDETLKESTNDYYFGKEAYEKFHELVLDNCQGMTISKSRQDEGKENFIGTVANNLGIDLYELLETLEGMCYNGEAKEVNDHEYEIKSGIYTKSFDISKMNTGDSVDLDSPYYLRKYGEGEFQISSSHPYDMTDYSYAKSFDGVHWRVYDPAIYTINTGELVQPAKKYEASSIEEAIEQMKKIDSEKTARIDRT